MIRATPALAGTRIVSPAPRQVWRDVMASDPDTVVTQSPEWLDCLCSTRGFVDASRFYILPDGRRLVLPLVAREVAGVRLSEESMPYGWGYGGVIAEGGELTAADRGLVLSDLAGRRVVRSVLVPNPLAGAGWAEVAPAGTVQAPYTSAVIDLEGGFDLVWSKRFRRQARNSVRKAERFALDVRREHGGRGVDMFAELHRRSIERWAEQRGQPLPVARLLAARRDRPGQVAAVSRAMGESCVIWSASRDGEPVAVNVVLQAGNHALGWLSAMNMEVARETLATYQLQSMAIEDACRNGARWFHMGESEAGSGAERFKTYFGATPVEYHSLRFERLPLTRAEHGLREAFDRVSSWRARRTETRTTDAA